MRVPDCYDPAFQEELRQLKWDKIISNLPRCGSCREPLYQVQYLDLSFFGLGVKLCEDCCQKHSRWADFIEEECM